MRISWRNFYRRLAVACAAVGSAAWTSAMCHAVQLAHDSADDPVYADGWQAGDNGGTGFTAWNFDSSYFWPGDGNWYPYTMPDFHAVDDGLRGGTHYSNPFNNIGKSLALGIAPNNDGPPRAGRGFPALQPGQTISVVVDNPTDRKFGGGYFIRLNGGTGGMNGNICNAEGRSCTPNAPTPADKLVVWRYEYVNDGVWQIGDFAGDVEIPLFDTDTAAAGMRLDVTRTGAETYDLAMTPLGTSPAAPAYTRSGSFRDPGVGLDWIEFTFFNTATDTGTPPAIATDFYIRSMEILSAAPQAVPGDYNNNGSVDAADYVVWRDHSGQTFPLPNEVPGVTPGMVTPEDYTAWNARFGNTSGAGAGSGVATAAVPEPSTLASFVAALSAMAMWIIASMRRRGRAVAAVMAVEVIGDRDRYTGRNRASVKSTFRGNWKG